MGLLLLSAQQVKVDRFPPEANFDLSRSAINRAVSTERPDGGKKDGAELRSFLNQVLDAMKEGPIWPSTLPTCRLVGLMHRSFLSVRITVAKAAATEVSKLYVQGTSDSGVGLTRVDRRTLPEDQARALLDRFQRLKLTDIPGFRQNTSFPDGHFTPLNGTVLIECSDANRYGFALLEPPIEFSTPGGTEARAAIDAVLVTLPENFLPQHLREEYER